MSEKCAELCRLSIKSDIIVQNIVFSTKEVNLENRAVFEFTKLPIIPP